LPSYFALALDFDDLGVFAPRQAFVDLDVPPEIKRGVLDGKDQILCGLIWSVTSR